MKNQKDEQTSQTNQVNQTNQTVEERLEEETVKAQIEMKDTVTEAKLSINAKNISTLSESENIIFNATLISNNQTQDLYKNPTLDIYLPKEVENIEINSVKVLYINEEEMTIDSYDVVGEDGRNVIKVVLSGEQTEYVNKANKGIQVVIDTNISVRKETPTKTAEIEMKYTNENGNNEEYITNTKIGLESKYGMFVYNAIESEEEKIDNINGNDIEGRLEINREEKTAKVNTLLLNNYLEPVNNVAIIGNLNTEGSNIDVTLTDKIELENAKIYYATENTEERESENWQEEVENIEEVKAYKIELENLNQEENTRLSYDLKIPGDLDYNQKSLSNIKVLYDYANQEQNANTNISLSTIEAKINNQEQIIDTENLNKQEIEGIGNVYVKSTYADSVLENGQSVTQGQSIKNTVVIENTTEEELTDINVTAMQSNANFFIVEKSEEPSSEGGILQVENTRENTEVIENRLDIIKSLKPGEKATLEYQYVIKEDAVGSTVGTLKINVEDKEEREIKISENPIEEGKLKLIIQYGYNETGELYGGGSYKLIFATKNMSQETLKDVIVDIHISDTIEFNENDFNERYFNDKNIEVLENKDRIVKIKINEIKAEEEKYLLTIMSIKQIDTDVSEVDCRVYCQSILDNKVYTSNEANKKASNVEAKLEIEQTGSSKEQVLKNGDELIYTTKIKNISINDKQFEITDDVPQAAVIQEAYFESGEEKTPIENIENNKIQLIKEIKAKSEITLVISTKIDVSKATNYAIKNTVYFSSFAQVEKSNTVEYTLDFSPTKGETEKNISNEISGTVWADKNKDGKKETSEEKLQGVEVQLVDANTEEIVKDKDERKIQTTTDAEGNYKLTGMPNGEYIVVFKYDTAKYTPTEYRRAGLSFSQNSDIIQGEVKEETVAVTDKLVFNGTAYAFIDAGFMENFEFDLKLDKYISKVIAQTEKGTGVQEYNKEQLAKIEIPSQYLNNTTVLVEYRIEVTNEGEIEGYANEIIDYMPKDMTFSSELNKDWYIGTDGNLHTVALTNEIIKQGETKTITLVLTKTMNQNNTGTSTNIAEIAKSSNSLSITDIDSSPGNYADEEDDISTAEILISISTGALQITLYVLIAMIILTGIGYEVYKIKIRREG